MKNLLSLRVRNLRSFSSTGEHIPLRKINLFVGRNSCGKSTFLRTFPLLRQSVEANTKSPILWYGDYVDFGDLKTAMNSGADEVFFDFKMCLPIDTSPDLIERMSMGWDIALEYFKEKIHRIDFPVELTLGMSITKNNETLSRVIITTSGVTLEIAYRETSVDFFEIKSESSKLLIRRDGGRIIAKGKLIPIQIGKVEDSQRNTKSIFNFSYRPDFLSEFSKFISKFHHGNKTDERIETELSKIHLCKKSAVLQAIKRAFRGNKHFEASLSKNSTEIADGAFFYLVAINHSKFLKAADEALHNFYSGIRYLGPLRASAERFYRHQDLQVAEVDHTGANLPMVLNSLTKLEKEDLNSWTAENFGFELKLTNSGLHYAISIKEIGGSGYNNVSDMGFGYSQILPLIVSVWLENERINKEDHRQNDEKQVTITIEQPELHLHPELQHRFGVAISKIAKSCSNSNFCFVIETHSKHIIDALGECVEEKIISNEDVGISLFEKNSHGETKTTLSGFDNKGYLLSWPAGFLSP